MSPRVLGVIPARAGSKRVPGKNLRQLCGKPLIAWTIEAASTAHKLTDWVVSTECETIAHVAILHGAYVVRRPEELAEDSTPSGAVVSHALGWMETDNSRYDLACLLHPTSPVRDAAHIDAAIDLLWNSGADTLASVSCRKRNYQHNASLYVMRTSWLRANPNKHYDDATIPFMMDARHSIDIDQEDDLKIAEIYLRNAYT